MRPRLKSAIRHLPFAVLCVFAIWPALHFTAGAGPNVCFGDPYDSRIDPVLIMRGALHRPLLSLWTGPWVQAPVSLYWRPLPSTLFYFEARAFGWEGMLPFQLVHIALSIALIMLVWGFLRALLGNRTALMAFAVWCTSIPCWLGLPFQDDTFTHWKDAPDILCAIGYIGSLWCLLRRCGCDGKGASAPPFGSLALFVVAILGKEAAFTLPVVAAALLWHQRRNDWKGALAPLLGAWVFGLLAWRIASGPHSIHPDAFRMGLCRIPCTPWFWMTYPASLYAIECAVVLLLFVLSLSIQRSALSTIVFGAIGTLATYSPILVAGEAGGARYLLPSIFTAILLATLLEMPLHALANHPRRAYYEPGA